MSGQQPYLHGLVPLLAGPTQVWCSADGDIEAGSVGIIASDIQVLSRLAVRIDDEPVTWIHRDVDGLRAVYTGVVRHLQDETVDGADPRVVATRTRTLGLTSVSEQLEIRSGLDRPLEATVVVELEAAAESIDEVKQGRRSPVSITTTGATRSWGNRSITATLTSDGELTSGSNPAQLWIRRRLQLARGGADAMTWRLELAASPATPVVAAQHPPEPPPVPPAAAAMRCRRWLNQSLTDLAALRLEHRAVPGQPFYGAGAPWYLTLFGRDSLWAARLARAYDPSTAASTLRVLATFQGQRHDPESEEAPGKIIHEIRGGEFTVLPTRYFGTIDATPLWVNLLTDLVDSSNLDLAEVAAWRPVLGSALSWITGPDADPDNDGFLEYTAPAGRGLTNQGWKDSVDAVRFADGRIADGPIALCEVQGYAYAAATRGADLMGQLGADSTATLSWARRLRDRFQSQFCPGRFPVFALDGDKRPVNSTTSNIGHLLGTGILDADQEQAVADRLVQPDMLSGLGLRTMSTQDGGYHPLSYHCGSVWAHDTAIVIDGMLRAGLTEHAAVLARGLLAAADKFGGRLPELWSGDPTGIPYPAACHPQAWAAAAAVPAVQALRDVTS